MLLKLIITDGVTGEQSVPATPFFVCNHTVQRFFCFFRLVGMYLAIILIAIVQIFQ